MKNRKQLPCFGYLKNQSIDTPALIAQLQQDGMLDTERYNSCRADMADHFQGYVLANGTTLNSYFKEDGAPSLHSSKFRQIQLTTFDQAKSRGPVTFKPTTFVERVRRLDPADPRYVPEADELNYGIRTELVKGEFEKIFNLFSSKITRARLTFLMAGHEIKPHLDYDPTYITRFHMPVITHPDVIMYMERNGKETSMHMPADGKIYFFNAGIKHWVKNNSQIDRLHLIIDVHGQAELENLVSLPE